MLNQATQIRSFKWKLQWYIIKYSWNKTVSINFYYFFLSSKNKILISVVFFFYPQKKKKTSSKLFILFIYMSQAPCIVLSLVHFSLQLSLSRIHQDGNGQASWLHLKRHTYQGALSLHLSFSLRLKHGPCQCTGWIYHSLSFSIPALLCCQCYHAALRVRKGLSGYSSHYWLLNLVMVVKALPVPLRLRGQMMACFMSLQRRASLLGHRFIHTPLLIHAPSQRQDGWMELDRLPFICPPLLG